MLYGMLQFKQTRKKRLVAIEIGPPHPIQFNFQRISFTLSFNNIIFLQQTRFSQLPVQYICFKKRYKRKVREKKEMQTHNILNRFLSTMQKQCP